MTFGKLSEPSSFGARLDMLAADRGPWYIVRDRDGDADHAVVWNWQERCWAFDIDGDYRESNIGWAYRSKGAAVSRSKAGSTHADIGGYTSRGYRNGQGITPKNVRVVSEDELYEMLGLQNPHW